MNDTMTEDVTETPINVEREQVLADFSLRTVYMPSVFDGDGKLRFIVHLFFKEKLIVTTEYSMGVAHIPGFDLMGWQGPRTVHDYRVINTITQVGRGEIRKDSSGQIYAFTDGPFIEPKLDDVVYCLLSDGSASTYDSFEHWASEFGYDTDSRKAEHLYHACLAIDQKLRAGLGNDLVEQLHDLFQDY